MTHYMCDMTHSYVWHDSFLFVTWLIDIISVDMSKENHFTCVKWLIHMWDMTHSLVWHNLFTCVTWLIHTCDMTHSYQIGRHVKENIRLYMYFMTHSYVWHDSSVTHTEKSCHAHEWVMSHMWMSHGTHVKESCPTYECVMFQIWMRHLTYMNALCDKREGDMPHIWMSHVPHIRLAVRMVRTGDLFKSLNRGQHPFEPFSLRA